MSNSIKILFWIHRSKQNVEGKVPLILRVTHKKERLDKSTGIYVQENKWNGQKQKLRGNNKDVESINNHIDNIRTKIFQIFNKAH